MDAGNLGTDRPTALPWRSSGDKECWEGWEEDLVSTGTWGSRDRKGLAPNGEERNPFGWSSEPSCLFPSFPTYTLPLALLTPTWRLLKPAGTSAQGQVGQRGEGHSEGRRWGLRTGPPAFTPPTKAQRTTRRAVRLVRSLPQAHRSSTPAVYQSPACTHASKISFPLHCLTFPSPRSLQMQCLLPPCD